MQLNFCYKVMLSKLFFSFMMIKELRWSYNLHSWILCLSTFLYHYFFVAVACWLWGKMTPCLILPSDWLTLQLDEMGTVGKLNTILLRNVYGCKNVFTNMLCKFSIKFYISLMISLILRWTFVVALCSIQKFSWSFLCTYICVNFSITLWYVQPLHRLITVWHFTSTG